MTVLLAMTVFMLVVMENIPPTSEVVPLLGMVVCTQCNNTNRICLTLEKLGMELLSFMFNNVTESDGVCFTNTCRAVLLLYLHIVAVKFCIISSLHSA